jgi:diacylglycerol kinase family enzyme
VAGFLLVNPSSGDGECDRLVAEARSRGVQVHVLAGGDDPVELARTADADALGVAGGDGSLAPVAAVAVERSLPFVCIPFGTRNHFARDVGLDRDDPLGGLAAFESGRERRVDLGFAGDRPFLNNVSIGAYATLVHRRERHRRRRVAFARLRALAILATHRSERLVVDGEPVDAHVLLVANNAYEVDVLSIGERERIDAGELHLYTARGLLPSAWDDRPGSSFEVDAPASRVRAAVDGEPVALATPVRFRIEPGALRVLLPADG